MRGNYLRIFPLQYVACSLLQSIKQWNYVGDLRDCQYNSLKAVFWEPSYHGHLTLVLWPSVGGVADMVLYFDTHSNIIPNIGGWTRSNGWWHWYGSMAYYWYHLQIWLWINDGSAGQTNSKALYHSQVTSHLHGRLFKHKTTQTIGNKSGTHTHTHKTRNPNTGITTNALNGRHTSAGDTPPKRDRDTSARKTIATKTKSPHTSRGVRNTPPRDDRVDRQR